LQRQQIPAAIPMVVAYSAVIKAQAYQWQRQIVFGGPRDFFDVSSEVIAEISDPPAAKHPVRQVAPVPVEAVVDPPIRLVASDDAGNEGQTDLMARVIEKRFAEGRVSLPASFLERRAVPLAEANGFDTSDPVAAFQSVNTELRKRN
jgi:hypothetical protein